MKNKRMGGMERMEGMKRTKGMERMGPHWYMK